MHCVERATDHEMLIPSFPPQVLSKVQPGKGEEKKVLNTHSSPDALTPATRLYVRFQIGADELCNQAIQAYTCNLKAST